jgi:Transposase DDE domain
MTSQSMGSLSAMDILSLYRGRGGFEQQLSQEDQEQDYDRWCSWQPGGQEFWQILGQWSWNWRVWMGWQQKQEVRQTEWAEGESEDERVLRMGWRGILPPPVLPPSLRFMKERPGEAKPEESVATSVPPVIEGALSEVEPAQRYGAMEVSTEWGGEQGKGKRFGNEDFRIVDEQTVLCPAGHPMNRQTSKPDKNGDLRMQFGIKASLCRRCPVKRQCLSPQSKGVGGRRVTVIRRAISRAKGIVAKMSAIVRSCRVSNYFSFRIELFSG